MKSHCGCSRVVCPNEHEPESFVVNINQMAKQNPYYRTELWTGESLQVTLMTIPINGEIGEEMHSNFDQFIKIEEGCALIEMGGKEAHLNMRKRANKNYAVMIPSGTWHNILNIGNVPLKLYSIYAPPEHPIGTVHKTKADAEKAEKQNVDAKVSF